MSTTVNTFMTDSCDWKSPGIDMVCRSRLMATFNGRWSKHSLRAPDFFSTITMLLTQSVGLSTSDMMFELSTHRALHWLWAGWHTKFSMVVKCAFAMSWMLYSLSYFPTSVNTSLYSDIISPLVREGRCSCCIFWHEYTHFTRFSLSQSCLMTK